jgi:hypothetical protein
LLLLPLKFLVMPANRGLHSLRFQLNLSSSVFRVTQLNPECILELLKLSSNVNECKPLPVNLTAANLLRRAAAAPAAAAPAEAAAALVAFFFA